MCGWGELRLWVPTEILYPGLLAGTLEWLREKFHVCPYTWGCLDTAHLLYPQAHSGVVEQTIVSGTSRVSVGLVPPQKAALTLAALLWLD